MNVDVYKNLHKDTWSVRDRSTGLVVDHDDYVVVENAQFIVQPAGRRKVLREQKKNVHAFVRGTRVPMSELSTTVRHSTPATRVSYNPYKSGAFKTQTGRRVKEAQLVVMTPNGCYIEQKTLSEAPGGPQ